MAKSIGVAVLSLADALGALRPDVLLLIADRYEMLAPAAVALSLRIPIAHIEGGEISEGAIDDAVRNALTKMSHIHFTSTEGARARVIAMGEEAWRVHRAGAPSLDHLRRSRLLTREEVEARCGMDLHTPALLVAYHPVTLEHDTTAEAAALFAALEQIAADRDAQILFCYPNADAGSRASAREDVCESGRGDVLEFAAAGRGDDRQFEQRDHGDGVVRAAHSERGAAAEGARAGAERAGRGAGCRGDWVARGRGA
jgi:UDP-N-acetylglucosamine 2-epimerase (non-hydrolysing)/GDP/UDP-N,N'-diacetylbacillosamine 2-epimerase (hydrolysing)